MKNIKRFESNEFKKNHKFKRKVIYSKFDKYV